jgi:hypothetical protein
VSELCEQWSSGALWEQCRGSRGAVEGAVDVEGAAYAAGEVFTFEVMWISYLFAF